MEFVFSIIIPIGILVFSAILHEIAHGLVADRLGDPTARLMGRLTLDPRKHIDPFMSILLPALLVLSRSPVIFGGAKPVPVDPYNLREGRKDLALVSLAGPLTNLLLALLANIIIRVLLSFGGTHIPTLTYGILSQIVELNILLAIFNMIPIPPLDGSKVLSLFLPEAQARSYLALGSIGMYILFFLLVFPLGGISLGEIIFRLSIFAKNLMGYPF